MLGAVDAADVTVHAEVAVVVTVRVIGVQVIVEPAGRVVLLDIVTPALNPFLEVNVRVVELDVPGLLLTIADGFAAMLKLTTCKVKVAIRVTVTAQLGQFPVTVT